MLFVNFEKLKIEKSCTYHTFSTTVKEDLINKPIRALKAAAKLVVEELLANKPAIETCYEIDLGGDQAATEDEANDFIVIANIFISEFFGQITTIIPRKRERRLDVPDKLKVMKMSLSTLKRAVNRQTTIDNFNLVIKYKDLTYVLVDEKEDK